MAELISVTPSFGIEVENGRLRVVADSGFLVITGKIDSLTATALRGLADECDRVVPPSASPALGDLFDGDA